MKKEKRGVNEHLRAVWREVHEGKDPIKEHRKHFIRALIAVCVMTGSGVAMPLLASFGGIAFSSQKTFPEAAFFILLTIAGSFFWFILESQSISRASRFQRIEDEIYLSFRRAISGLEWEEFQLMNEAQLRNTAGAVLAQHGTELMQLLGRVDSAFSPVMEEILEERGEMKWTWKWYDQFRLVSAIESYLPSSHVR